MSGISRHEALNAARKMLRGFSGAPDPRQQAHRLYSELAHAAGWSRAEEAEIIAFGAWLQSRPALLQLRPSCTVLLAKFR
ncbi:MAG: hypothetical protein Q8Q88_06550 [Phenylobacterium sp.]|uniref:hypothetical protein n=1 Tax=Phenylobacterium sp. TaxID=1871053 RepID=UPI002736197F|nr:hypothetical protein [Phenylobacterium sp.]MDP3746694.1 hypothetical protein [Phenylobacterium sp.]